MNQTTDEALVAEIEAAQEEHLTWLETWAGSLPMINGVPVVKALNYELIQLINRAYLDAINKGAVDESLN
jgi:hypothetical protein